MAKKVNQFPTLATIAGKLIPIFGSSTGKGEKVTWEGFVVLLKSFFYDKNQTINLQASSFAGTVDSLTFDPGTPDSNVIFRANAGVGTYTKFLSAPSTPITVSSGDGQVDFIFNTSTGFFKKSALGFPAPVNNLTTSDTAIPLSAAQGVAIKTLIDANTERFNSFNPIESKKFNYLSNANELTSEWSAVSNPHAVFSYASINSTEPFPFPKPSIKIALTPTGANETAYIRKEIAVVPTDRVYIGGWFYTPFFANAGLSFAGFYLTEIISGGSGFITHASTNVLNSQIVAGHSHNDGNLTTKVVIVKGDWALFVVYNNADFDAAILRLQINLYMQLTGTPSTVTLYANNLTFLKNGGDISPFGIYDNSAFSAVQIQANQVSIQANQDSISALQSTASSFQTELNNIPSLSTTLVAAAKLDQVNPLNDGNYIDYFWTKYPTDAGLYIVNSAASVNPGKLFSPLLQINSATQTIALIAKNFAIKPTDNFITGFWYNHTEAIPGTLGFYIQIYGTDPTTPIQSAKHDLTALQRSVQGTTFSGGGFIESEVLLIVGDLTYIQCRNIAPVDAAALSITVNIFQDSITVGDFIYIHFYGITFLYDTVINPYVNYDNKGVIVGSGETWVFDGDSIIDQGAVTAAVAKLTGATIDHSMAVSGSGYTNTAGLNTPYMASSTRTNAIKAKKADVIVLEGGVNDFRIGATMGTLSEAVGGGTDYSKFYNAVYKRISQVQIDNPTATILVLTPYQNFYNGTESPTIANSIGMHQIDYRNAIIEVCQVLANPCLDWYIESGINANTQSFRLFDGLHPAGYDNQAMPLAKQIIGRVKSIRR